MTKIKLTNNYQIDKYLLTNTTVVGDIIQEARVLKIVLKNNVHFNFYETFRHAIIQSSKSILKILFNHKYTTPKELYHEVFKWQLEEYVYENDESFKDIVEFIFEYERPKLLSKCITDINKILHLAVNENNKYIFLYYLPHTTRIVELANHCLESGRFLDDLLLNLDIDPMILTYFVKKLLEKNIDVTDILIKRWNSLSHLRIMNYLLNKYSNILYQNLCESLTKDITSYITSSVINELSTSGILFVLRNLNIEKKYIDMIVQCSTNQEILFEIVKRYSLLDDVIFPIQHYNSDCYGTILHIAYGDIPFMQYLINNGIPIDSIDNYGNTLLHYAVITEDDEIIKFLLRNGAQAHIKNAYGQLPFEMVTESLHLKRLLTLLAESYKCDGIDCYICHDHIIDEYVVKLPCKHIFHRDCYTQWLGNCPTCRYEI